jgi:hypothetical protein
MDRRTIGITTMLKALAIRTRAWLRRGGHSMRRAPALWGLALYLLALALMALIAEITRWR